jgi:hypothetical protein
VFVLNRVSDLVVFSPHPRVVLVAVSVEFGQSLEALVGLAVVDEPSGCLVSWGLRLGYCCQLEGGVPGRLGEEHDEQT